MDRVKPYWSHSSLCWQITAHCAYSQPVSWMKKPHYFFRDFWQTAMRRLPASFKCIELEKALCFMNTIEDLSYWFYDKIWNITSNDAYVIFQLCLPRGNLFITWFPHLGFANCPGELFETKTMTSISFVPTPRTLSWPVNLSKWSEAWSQRASDLNSINRTGCHPICCLQEDQPLPIWLFSTPKYPNNQLQVGIIR